ncbi:MULTISPECIES: RDD family protein [unclassified Streptomyces]|uniref:RDD family protein n=1 Tax=unclassified Streptomyces TaxID=2593676 RepID=UPI0038047116
MSANQVEANGLVSATMARRYGGAAIDGVLAVLAGAVCGLLYIMWFSVHQPEPAAPPLKGLALRTLAGVAAFSFANQVLLTQLCRASLGKLMTGTRVVRIADAGRPWPWQLLWRWLGGVLYGCTIVPLAYALGGSEAPPADFAGVRIVRRK